MDSEGFFVGFIVTLLIGAVFGVAVWLSAESCESKSVSFDDHSYGPIQGCMVKHKGMWLPLENIRGFD